LSIHSENYSEFAIKFGGIFVVSTPKVALGIDGIPESNQVDDDQSRKARKGAEQRNPNSYF
jgi:hypothetical protein